MMSMRRQIYGYLPSLRRYQMYILPGDSSLLKTRQLDLTSRTSPGSNPGRYADHIFLVVAHATAMLSRQPTKYGEPPKLGTAGA